MSKNICNRYSILIIGFGRMGLSHAAQLGLSRDDCEIFVFDPSFKVKLLIRFLSLFTNLRYVSLKNLGLNQHYDLTVIASPPKYQSEYYDLLRNSSQKFLIEKPLGINFSQNDPTIKNVYVGYVLQHVKTFKMLKEILQLEKGSKFEIVVETNLSVGEMGGWRHGNFYGSFVSEYGSHAINLLLFLSDENYELTNLKLLDSGNQKLILTTQQSEATIILLNQSKNVRKTMYTVNVTLTDKKYSVDSYEIRQNEKVIYSVTNNNCAVNCYLRGEDFAAQTEHVLASENCGHALKYALQTKRILDHAKQKLSSTR